VANPAIKPSSRETIHMLVNLLFWTLLSLTGSVVCAAQHPGSRGIAWVLREDGIGPVKIGMTLAELNSVLHAEPSLTDDKDNEGCFM
ncbi:MAG: hypothetical protein M3O09_00275, partial [Acidobacteriota bacterium]|nr:hypothetical protein [Acidobacteriota bacterium]